MKRLLFILAVLAVLSATLGIWFFGQRLSHRPAIDPEAAYISDPRPDALDAYFKAKGMPLAGTGQAMVDAADENGLDWRLLPAIAVRESTGGKAACGFNPFGWASCKNSTGEFESWEAAIKTVAAHLGGNVTSTRRYYGGKDTAGKLNAYNPPTIVPEYTAQVMAIMKVIQPEP